MAPSAIYEPKVVNTTLNHWLDPALGGHTGYLAGSAEYYRKKHDAKPAQIHDIRGREDEFDLNTQGFQHHKHTSVEKNYLDDDRVRKVVYPETEKLLMDITGATRAHVFSHITRRHSREKVEEKAKTDPELLSDGKKILKEVVPARFVHIDQSEVGAVEVLEDNMSPEEVEKLSKSRWGIINVWRPIKPVSKDPLAMCDARSVRDEDLIPIVSSFPPKDPKGQGGNQYSDISAGKRFELYYLKHNEGQTWYYASRMKPDEVLLIKCYDSIRDGQTARRVPHSAFTDPETQNDEVRESIEIRTLVFWEDQPL